MNGSKFEDTSLFTATKHTHKKYSNKSYDHSSNIINTHKYVEDINDEGLLSLQYAINKQTVIDLKEKYNIESVKHLCDYLLSHIIEDEHTMKEVIYKALEERQMKSLKQLSKSIKESEDIINDMKLSLEDRAVWSSVPPHWPDLSHQHLAATFHTMRSKSQDRGNARSCLS